VPKGNASLLVTKLDRILSNSFESLIKASSRTEIENDSKIPETQGNRAYIPETLRKKTKYKRKATSPLLKE
jgi:hypothetical protein